MISGRFGLSARITVTILLILFASIAACFTIVYRNVAAVTGDAALREIEQSNLTVASQIKAQLFYRSLITVAFNDLKVIETEAA